MRNRLLASVRVIGFVAVAVTSAACPDRPDINGPTTFAVSSVIPNGGPVNIATLVQIKGTGFQAGATVSVGGIAVDATFRNSTTISVTTPARAAGRVDVIVTNPGGAQAELRDAFLYRNLMASSVSPTTGYIGDVVTIAGFGFSPSATLTIGGVPAAVTTRSSTMIVARAPDHAAGSADVVVTNPDGESSTLAAGYAYLPEPPTFTVTGLEPNEGVIGEFVAVHGSGFKLGTTVTIDGVPITPSITNTTAMSLEMPDHPAGPVDIVLTRLDGNRTERQAAFTYQTVTVSAGQTQAAVGGVLTVSWIAPPGRRQDVIALFREGGPKGSSVWNRSTRSAATGTLTLAAPTLAGRYEFFYFADFDANAPLGDDVYGLPAARSGLVNIVPASSPAVTDAADCASYLVDACVSVEADMAGRWKVTSSDPIRIASPSASGTALVTRRSPMNVPFLLPRSSIAAPFTAITSRAWRRETVEASSWTSMSGSRPTTFSPRDSGRRRLPQASQHRE